MRERALQRSVIRLLERHHPLWWLKTPSEGRNGVPDIVGCYRGQFFAWELKTKRGKLTKLQKIERDWVKRSEGQHKVIRSRQQATKALEELKRGRSEDAKRRRPHRPER